VVLEDGTESTPESVKDAEQFLIVGRVEGIEHDAPGMIRIKHTVQRDDVKVHVQVESIAEPLDEADAATLRVEDLALGADSLTHRGEQRPQEGPEDVGCEASIERHPIT